MANQSGEVIPAPDADLCLNFANTRYWRGSATPTEDLNTPDDLLRWAGAAERLPSALVKRFDQATIFSEAIRLRETIFRCFAATASRHARGRRRPRRAECRAGGGPGAAARAHRRLGHRHAGAFCRFASGAGAMVGGGSAGRQSARARSAMRQSAVRLAVSRQQQERQPALVLDERLRQPRQGASALSAAEGSSDHGLGRMPLRQFYRSPLPAPR